MPAYGFISDKLEIKFLILYIAHRLVEPVPFETLQELTMCDGGVDYFGFSECLADLVRTEHLTLSGGLYGITDKGRRNSAICENSLPYSVRIQAEQKLAHNSGSGRKSSTPGSSPTCTGENETTGKPQDSCGFFAVEKRRKSNKSDIGWMQKRCKLP